jgi:uncharacterized protein YjaG (DUF416 family)
LVALVMGESLLVYDETALKERVAGLPGSERVLLAAACAERLMPLYQSIASAAGSAGAAGIRSALDLAWSANASAQQAEQAQLEVEDLVPDEGDEDVPVDVALVQNAIAAVAYALRTVGSHDAQDAVWAARQLYEAADYIVQRKAPSQTYIEDLEQEAPVQLVLRGIGSALEDLESASLAQLRTRAQADGDALLVLFKAE